MLRNDVVPETVNLLIYLFAHYLFVNFIYFLLICKLLFIRSVATGAKRIVSGSWNARANVNNVNRN